jgi:hypothetical protein
MLLLFGNGFLSVSNDYIRIYKAFDGIMLVKDANIHTYLEYKKNNQYTLDGKILSNYLFDDIVGEMIIQDKVDEGSMRVITKYGSYTLFLKETADSIATICLKWKNFSNSMNNKIFEDTIKETVIPINRFNRIIFPYYMYHRDNSPKVNTMPMTIMPFPYYVPQINAPIHLKKTYTPAGYGIPGNNKSVEIEYTIY